MEKPKVITEKEGDITIVQILNKHLREADTIEALGLFFIDVLKKGAKKVVVEMSAVEHLTSAMIGKLVAFKKEADRQKAELRICGLRTEIENLFHITKLHQIFDFKSDRAKAIKSLKSSPFKFGK